MVQTKPLLKFSFCKITFWALEYFCSWNLKSKKIWKWQVQGLLLFNPIMPYKKFKEMLFAKKAFWAGIVNKIYTVSSISCLSDNLVNRSLKASFLKAHHFVCIFTMLKVTNLCISPTATFHSWSFFMILQNEIFR